MVQKIGMLFGGTSETVLFNIVLFGGFIALIVCCVLAVIRLIEYSFNAVNCVIYFTKWIKSKFERTDDKGIKQDTDNSTKSIAIIDTDLLEIYKEIADSECIRIMHNELGVSKCQNRSYWSIRSEFIVEFIYTLRFEGKDFYTINVLCDTYTTNVETKFKRLK